MLRYIIPIVPNVRGEVIEVPIEAMTRLQKGGTLFRIDRVPFEITVRQLKAQVAAYEAERRPAEINSAMWLCA